MRTRLSLFYLSLCLALVLTGFAAGCGGDEEGGKEDAGASGSGGSDDPDAGTGNPEGADGGADAGERQEFCGDGIVQEDLNEICDDGNFFDNDGCTSLCELSCEDDSDCDDGNICNGEETCNSDDYCEFGEYLDDGTKCAPRKTCFAGLCLDDVCGDKIVTEDLGEECDDGNAVDDDGCTSECKYTCTSNDDCEGTDPCSGATVCNTTTHTCGGDPLPDTTSCTMKNGEPGWCFNEKCVPADCGDEIVGGDEECDLGKENGKPGSGCSSDCKQVVCGNGKLEGDEQCDDDNQVNLDGCDENCQAEILFRFTRMDVLTDPAPNWCVYPGKNQFGSAFPGRVNILGSIEIDVLNDIINRGMNMAFNSCSANQILQIRGLDDISFTRSDDEVQLTAYAGELDSDATCPNPMIVDTGFYITGENIDENNRPIEGMDMLQRPGIIKTKTSIDLAQPEGSADVRAGTLKDFMMLLPVDTERMSAPPVSGLADGIELPEEYGYDDGADDEDHPLGIVCAAMDVTNMARAPIGASQESGGSCCKAAGGSYDVCQEGDVPGEDCDAMLSLFKEGCTVCVSSSLQLDCNDCDYAFEVIRPTEPDVDTDGDGENDAYTLVVGIQGMRIRSLGAKE